MGAPPPASSLSSSIPSFSPPPPTTSSMNGSATAADSGRPGPRQHHQHRRPALTKPWQHRPNGASSSSGGALRSSLTNVTATSPRGGDAGVNLDGSISNTNTAAPLEGPSISTGSNSNVNTNLSPWATAAGTPRSAAGGFLSNDYYDPSGLYSSPAYNSRRWSTYGGGYGAGGYGTGYGGYGYGSGYGAGGYGPYSHSWSFDPNNPMNAGPNHPGMMNSAFSTMHTTIHTFGMLADMLDSSFQALMTAFRALLGVSHHFGQLQAFIGVGLFALLRRLFSSPALTNGTAEGAINVSEFQKFASNEGASAGGSPPRRRLAQLLKLAFFVLIGLGTLVSGKRFLSWIAAIAREQQDRKWAPVVERLQEFEGRLARMEHHSRNPEFEYINSQTETESEGEYGEFEEAA